MNFKFADAGPLLIRLRFSSVHVIEPLKKAIDSTPGVWSDGTFPYSGIVDAERYARPEKSGTQGEDVVEHAFGVFGGGAVFGDVPGCG